MNTWSFYDPATGMLAGVVYHGPPEQLAANIPEDFTPIEGDHDALSKRVDLDTLEVVEYQPDAPADTDDRTWEWNEDTKRWQPVLTEAGRARQIRAIRDAKLAACDWTQLADVALGSAAQDWLDYRQALRDVPQQNDFPTEITWPDAPT